MPRRIQDIRPSNHRSIRIEPENKVRKQKTRKVVEESDDETEDVPIIRDHSDEVSTYATNAPISLNRKIPITPPITEYKPKRRISKWLVISLVLVVLIVVAGYFASTYYSQASFTIVPKIIPVSVNSTYVAQGTEDNTGLFYKVVTMKDSATTTVPATTGAIVSTKATGKVTLYNYYGNQGVKLIAGTRLTRENGLIYRLNSSVVIPGSTKSGTNTIPGKINTSIVADAPGQSYNLTIAGDNSDLKIVAYKGSPKYDSIYARLTSDITGGFSGAKKNISSSTLATATLELKKKLSDKASAEIKNMIPDGYIMYDKGYSVVYSSPVITDNDKSTANINIQSTVYGITFPRNRFVAALAGEQTVSLFSPFSYTALGLEDLSVTINNIKDFSPTKKNALVLKIKGDMKIVGTVPVEEIKNKLKGLALADVQEIFKNYNAVIESGSGELVPPWAKIPMNTDKIKVTVEKP